MEKASGNVLKTSARELAYVSLFVVITAVCSWISLPFAVPFTLQTFAVYLSFFTLKGRKSLLSIVSYITLGLIGVPVFSSFKSGASVLFGATGGYIWGFILVILILWAFTPLLKNKVVLILACLISLFVCYLFGTVFFVKVYSQKSSISFIKALSLCVFPFILPDILKIFLAYVVSEKIKKIIKSQETIKKI